MMSCDLIKILVIDHRVHFYQLVINTNDIYLKLCISFVIKSKNVISARSTMHTFESYVMATTLDQNEIKT